MLLVSWPCFYFKGPIAVLAAGLIVCLAISSVISIALKIAISLLR